MFALFNPPSGAKYGKKKSKGKSSKKRKSPYQAYVSKYFASHPGTTMAAAAKSWSGGEGKIRAHHRARASYHKGAGKKYMRRSEVPGIISSAMKSNICNVSALQRARAKYCGTGAKTGMGNFIEKFKGASTAIGDRLFSAAERGYRHVANNPRGRKRRKSRNGKSASFSFAPASFKKHFSMNAPTTSSAYGGALDGLQPKNITGVVPIIGGYAIGAMVSGYLSKKIPYTSKGIGNLALSLASAGVLGATAGQFLGKSVGGGVLIGAIVEPLARTFNEITTKGLSALSLAGWSDDRLDDRFNANVLGSPFGERLGDRFGNVGAQLGDFTTPGQITGANPTESSMSQYSLPAATQANVIPQTQFSPAGGGQHPSPAQAHEDAAVAAAMDSSGMM